MGAKDAAKEITPGSEVNIFPVYWRKKNPTRAQIPPHAILQAKDT
jgi:hypothetical protein